MPNATVPAAAPGLPIALEDPAALRSIRKQIAARIERDIAFLDLLDGDPDLEPDNDDEPSLGSLMNPSQIGWSGGGMQDLEGEWA